MGRKANLNKRPISNKDRVRMHRRRKKLKAKFREREQLYADDSVETDGSINAQVHPLQENVESTLKIKLRDWATTHRVSKRAIDDLLGILISCGIESVPKNHRTLQSTPTNIRIDDVAGGRFWFNGLEKCLRQIFVNIDRDIEISLSFNIDGLPLYKSSTITFWPILAAIHGTKIY